MLEEYKLTHHLITMMQLAKSITHNTAHLAHEVGTTNAKGDKTNGMDVKIEAAMIDYIKKHDIAANIFSEEIGLVEFHKNPEYLIAFDPLNGSMNYKIGKNIYPYGFLIAIYKGTHPRIKDVFASGAIEFSNNLAWVYNDKITTGTNNKKITLKSDWPLNKSTPVFLDLFYKEGYEKYRMFPEKVFVRNIGSSIGPLSYLLSNISAAMGGIHMQPEEIGAIYSLIKGAGGVIVDHNGIDLGDMLFSQKSTYEILAGCKNIVDYLVGHTS